MRSLTLEPTHYKTHFSQAYIPIKGCENLTGIVDFKGLALNFTSEKEPLYPQAELLSEELVPVPKSDEREPQHEILVSQYGNIEGEPVVLIHGGPTLDIKPENLGFLNPNTMRIILIRQRGSIGCFPEGELVGNTTRNLVIDHKYVRKYLGITDWHVFGHSMGATLACIYAAGEIEHCRSLTCVAPFLACNEAVDLLLLNEYQRSPGLKKLRESSFGASHGDELTKYVAPLILSSDHEYSLQAAMDYTNLPREKALKLMTYLRVCMHYRLNNYFLENDWLEQISPELLRIPIINIAHSFEDRVLPMEFSLKLFKALKEKANFTPLCGDHFFRNTEAQKSLRALCDRIYI
ncbi:MAG: alpha/beta fold hydrolase [Bdellovibrionales bacterium]|nr:alpha/beta fold hydrolase [Bdellovibrionales bacterium]